MESPRVTPFNSGQENLPESNYCKSTDIFTCAMKEDGAPSHDTLPPLNHPNGQRYANGLSFNVTSSPLPPLKDKQTNEEYTADPPPYQKTDRAKQIPKKCIAIGVTIGIIVILIAVLLAILFTTEAIRINPAVTEESNKTVTVPSTTMLPSNHTSTHTTHFTTKRVSLHTTTTTRRSGATTSSTPSPIIQRTTSTPNQIRADTSPNIVAPTEDARSTWSAWTIWSNCDVTCGFGKYSRTRNCLTGECIGINAQQGTCERESCPRLVDQYGTWSSWFSWSPCSSSCGDSTQSRTRVCNKDADELNCIGDSAHTRPCNDGSCPDCSKQCSDGSVLSNECTICVCVGTSGSGIVLTNAGSPLDLVKVSPLEVEYETLDITDDTGAYELTNICVGDTLLFDKEGFIPTTVNWAMPMPIVRLQKIIRLDITKHPLSASRLVGGCAELNCEASGSPEPAYYEWFHNDIVLSSKEQSIQLNNIQLSDAGSYKCRASNDYGSAYSVQAEIHVRENPNAFCDSIPSSNVVDLPEGCTLNGLTSIDKGRCSPLSCDLGTDTTCTMNAKSRCGVIRFERQEIDCDSYTLAIFIAKECGCREHTSYEITLTGTVLSKETNIPVFQANIVRNDNVVVSTNWFGKFEMIIEPGVQRLSFFVNDPSGQHFEQSVVLNLQGEPPSKLSKVIYLQPKPDPFILLSNVENVVPFQNNNMNTSYSLTIPADSVFTADGNAYNGPINTYVNMIDTGDPEMILDAPGDFTAISEDGEEEMLESLGMFRIDLQDQSGNRLALRGNITIDLEIEDVEAANRVKLWYQDGNSRWVFVSDMTQKNDSSTRGKRQISSLGGGRLRVTSVIRGDTISGYWYNFDFISNQICHTKVRVYETDLDGSALINSANIRVITKQGSASMVSSYRARTDFGNNGYCIVHPCNTLSNTGPTSYRYSGYIIADYDTKHMIPFPDAPTFPVGLQYTTGDDGQALSNFDLTASTNGPFYRWNRYWKYSHACSKAGISAPHFRFYETKAKANCTLRQMTVVPDFSDVPLALFWDSISKQPDANNVPFEKYKKCFVKVVTNVTDDNIIIHSISKVHSYTGGDVNQGDLYGTRAECTEDGVACMEIKTPGYIAPASGQNQQDPTDIVIYPDSKSTQYLNGAVYDLNDVEDGTITNVNYDPSSFNVSFTLAGGFDAGTSLKIYCGEDDHAQTAYDIGKNKCMTGTNDGTGNTDEQKWAVYFYGY